jgi:hypothetical protein
MADYQMPHIGNWAVSTGLAGGVGTIVAFGLALLLARALVPKAAAAQEESESPMATKIGVGKAD